MARWSSTPSSPRTKAKAAISDTTCTSSECNGMLSSRATQPLQEQAWRAASRCVVEAQLVRLRAHGRPVDAQAEAPLQDDRQVVGLALWHLPQQDRQARVAFKAQEGVPRWNRAQQKGAVGRTGHAVADEQPALLGFLRHREPDLGDRSTHRAHHPAAEHGHRGGEADGHVIRTRQDWAAPHADKRVFVQGFECVLAALEAVQPEGAVASGARAPARAGRELRRGLGIETCPRGVFPKRQQFTTPSLAHSAFRQG